MILKSTLKGELCLQKQFSGFFVYIHTDISQLLPSEYNPVFPELQRLYQRFFHDDAERNSLEKCFKLAIVMRQSKDPLKVTFCTYLNYKIPRDTQQLNTMPY